jgi:transposase InsO family protein
MRVGELLLRERKNRGILKCLAQVLGVTPQTLRNWRKWAAQAEKPRLGRPRHTQAQRDEVDRLVAAEMEKQCNPGWRPISKALPKLPVRLVQEAVARVKEDCRKRNRKRREAGRVATTVLAREAVWTIDGAQTKPEGEKQFSQAVKDRGSLAYRAVQSGPPATGEDVVGILESQPVLPLVLASDNDKIYCGNHTSEWLEANKIVHLRSLPRTPQHNGAMEIGIRALKEAAEPGGKSLADTAKQINECRLWASKGYKTSVVLDAELPVAYHKVSRDVFYERCMMRLRRVAESPMKWREKRLVGREVIYATLEEYGLIKRTGGEGSWCRINAKIFL